SIANSGDTYQGDANNTNSGQANQQENRQASFSGDNHKSSDCGCSQPKEKPQGDCGCSQPKEQSHGDCGCSQPKEQSHGDCGCSQKKDDSGQSQTNSGRQSQVQILTESEQFNLQNLSVLNSGDTYQGDANNSNSGQANQQENRQASFTGGKGVVW
ncbi:MAG: hypothetical protein WBB76_04275, partial [Gaiellaceae bacterium]